MDVESKDEEQAELEKKQEYDKVQQQIDQERANAKKAREAAEQAKSEATKLADSVAELKSQIEATKQELEAKKTAIDPDEVGISDLANYAKNLQSEIAELKREQTAFKTEQQKLQADRQKAQQETEVNKVKEQILTDCDEEYGEQFRNAALKLADKKVDSGDAELPRTPYDGYKLMRKCYAEVALQKKKDTVITDTGEGGVGEPKSTLKPGSRQEVLEQMKKNPKSWKARAG